MQKWKIKKKGLTRLQTSFYVWLKGGTWLLPGECVPGIVHDTVEVIDLSQRVHLPGLHLQKVILLSCEMKK